MIRMGWRETPMASLRTLLMMSVFVLLWHDGGSEVLLHPTSSVCNTSTSWLECDLQDQDGRLIQGDISRIAGTIIRNANSLIIENQCHGKDKDIKIFDSTNVLSKLMDNFVNCTVGLRLVNSSASSLHDIFSKIRVSSSNVTDIRLNVEQFDITDNSTVDRIDITSYKERSTVIDSRLGVVKKMEINGIHRFEISGSFIGELQKLTYNTNFASGDNPTIQDTEIGSILTGGIEMMQGTLLLQNVTCHSLLSESIVLYEGDVTLKNVTIVKATRSSIVTKGPVTIKFENVSVGGKVFYNLDFVTKESTAVWPLAVMNFDDSSLPMYAVIMISAFVSLILGAIATVVILRCCPFFSFIIGKNNKKNERLPLTSVSAHSPDTMPPPPTPLVDHSAKDKKKSPRRESEYDYTDVAASFSTQDTSNNTSNRMAVLPVPDTSPPLPACPPPSAGIGNQLQSNPQNKPSASYESPCDDDEEPIYDECENFQNHLIVAPREDKPQVPPTKPNAFKLPKNPTAVLKKFPSVLNTEKHGDLAIDSPKGHQAPLIPQTTTNKPSFLHNASKPPPPPRGNTSAISQANNSAVKSPIKPPVPGRPLFPPPGGQIKYSDTLSDNEDIYEEIGE